MNAVRPSASAARVFRCLRRATSRTPVAITLIAVLMMFTASVGYAAWTSTGSGTGSASTGTLNPPTRVAATSTPGSGATNVSWTASTGSPAPTGYYVTRTASNNATSAACGTSPASLTTSTSCNDTFLTADTYTYVVTAVYRSWTARSVPSAAVNVTTTGSASKLAFTTSPAAATSGAPFGTQPVVTVQDTNGYTVTTDTSSVTLTITPGTGTPGAVLTCTANPKSAVGGVASFAGCTIDRAGAGYTLTATDGSLAVATSAAFNVTAGAAGKLVFTTQPSSTTGGVAFGTQPAVAVQDANGNTVTTDTSSVTLAIAPGTGTAGAVLTCTANPTSAVGGVASFAGCTIDKAGTGYRLIATDGSLTSATSNAFDVTVGAAAKLAFTTQPSTSNSAGAVFGTQPVVTVQDAGGNTVTSNTSAVTLAITAGTGTSGAVLTCTANPKSATAGVASFAGCRIDKGGAGYTLTATAGSLTSATSTSVNVFGPTGLTISNGAGGTVGKAEAGDVITITWAQAIDLGSVCSTWTSSAQAVTGITVTMNRGNGGATNNLTLSSGTVGSNSCAGGVKVGTFDTGSSQYESGNTNHVFSNSTMTWNGTQLVITLGSGTAAPGVVASSTYTYTPNAVISLAGNSAIKAGGTASTGNVQNF